VTARPPLSIRQAVEADLATAYEIYYEHEVLDAPDPPPRGGVPTWLEHELATGEICVAERGGRMVGFAALLPRGEVDYLAELFVRPAERSSGVGTALLRRLMPPPGPGSGSGERLRCTLSSRDPRALALYVRAGMRPWWPNLWLRGDPSRLRGLPRGEVKIVAAAGDDPELLRWDAAASGRYRPADHHHWRGEGGVPVWCERRGRRVGYGYVRPRSGSFWSPESTTVGPVGAASAGDGAECLCAVVAYACEWAEAVRLAIPAPHPGLRALLEAGFRIVDTETFVSTAPLLDPQRYAGSGDLF
jgi:GNAT superfamily N-acetyltransferase